MYTSIKWCHCRCCPSPPPPLCSTHWQWSWMLDTQQHWDLCANNYLHHDHRFCWYNS